MTTDLSTRLDAEHDALKSFIALLETEQQALLGGDIEKLMALSESKIKAANKLAVLAEERRNDLRARGATTEAGDTVTWLQSHAPSLLPVWRSIRQCAEKAQQINQANGALIQARMRHNQQALMALQNAANSANSLYGPDGQPRIAATGRALGSV